MTALATLNSNTADRLAGSQGWSCERTRFLLTTHNKRNVLCWYLSLRLDWLSLGQRPVGLTLPWHRALRTPPHPVARQASRSLSCPCCSVTAWTHDYMYVEVWYESLKWCFGFFSPSYRTHLTATFFLSVSLSDKDLTMVTWTPFETNGEKRTNPLTELHTQKKKV